MKDLSPVIVYTLKPSIRSKIFNYKEFTNSIDVFDNVTAYPCSCRDSSFVDIDHGHIVTGDLRIIQNSKLRKLFVKGPKYREPSLIDFSKAKQCINNGLREFITSNCKKLKMVKGEFSEWKQVILDKLDQKITILKHKVKVRQISKTLSDKNANDCLENLKEKYVLVPIDRAANNVAFVCKRFYAEK